MLALKVMAKLFHLPGVKFSSGTAIGSLVRMVGTEGNECRPVKRRLRWVLVLADPELVQFPGSWVSAGFLPLFLNLQLHRRQIWL